MSGHKKDFNELEGGSKIPHAKLVKAFDNEPVRDIECGHNYVCCVTMAGDLYSWGNNSFQQLGLGKKYKNQKDVLKPTKVPFFESNNLKVMQASCSKGDKHCHTHAVTESGEVFSWGDEYKG